MILFAAAKFTLAAALLFNFTTMKKIVNVLLDLGNYIPYNVEIAKALGSVEACVIFSAILNKYNYFEREGKLDSEGYFFCTSEMLENLTAINRRSQESAVKILISNKLIDKKLKGVPAKTHYRLTENYDTNLQNLLNLFVQNGKSSLYKNAKLDCTKTPNLNGENGQTIYNIKKDNKENNNTHINESVCDSFSLPNFGKDLGTESLPIKEMDLDISTEKDRCNIVALKYTEIESNPNTTPANATLLQKAKEIGMVTRSEKFEMELLQKNEISVESALLALTNYATELQEKNAIGTRFVSSFKNFFGEGKYSAYLAVILPTIETEAKTVTYNGKEFEVVRAAKNGQKYASYNGSNDRVKKAMKNKADFAVTDKEGKLYDFGKDYGFEENQNRDFLKYIVEKG